MTYDHDRREEWFAWFLDPTTQDDKTLAHALSNVPPDHWLFVENRIRTALGEIQASFSERVSRKEGGGGTSNEVSNAVNSRRLKGAPAPEGTTPLEGAGKPGPEVRRGAGHRRYSGLGDQRSRR